LTRRRLLPGIVLVLVLVAFGLRLYRLDSQPLRGDESFTIQFSSHPLSWLVPAIANIEPNPPLYYFLLHYWMAILGQSEFVTRYLSLLFGVLCVPLAYLLGQTLGWTWAGALAAFFVAINPFQVWHAQDVRNYTVWPALSMGALIFLVHALQKDRIRYWAGYAVMALLSLYTHYYDLFMLVFYNLFFVTVLLTGWHQTATFRSSRPRLLATWLVVQAMLAMTLGPWLLYGSSRLLFYTTRADSPALWEIFLRSLTAFSLGETVSPTLAAVSSPVLLLALIAGLTHSFTRNRTLRLFLILYIVVPSICIFIACQVRPLFRERYLNVVSPAYYLALSYGLLTLRRYLPRWKLRSVAVGIALFGLIAAYSLSNHYWNPAYSKSPDWRALTEHLATETSTDDVIVLNYPDPSFSYYYGGTAPSFVLPSGPLGEDVKSDTAAALRLLSERYQRIWFYPLRDAGWDSEGFVNTWLSRHATLAEEQNISGFRWLVFRPVIVSSEDVQNPLDVRFGDRIRLWGYDWQTGEGEDSETCCLDPGSALRLTLFWQATDRVKTSYTVFIHLTDAQDRIWAQRDSVPQGGDFPTDEWMEGDVIIDRYSILPRAEIATGEYVLSVGMYDASTGQRLPIYADDQRLEGDRLLLGLVRVLPRE
jgi:mannosyltransferase